LARVGRAGSLAFFESGDLTMGGIWADAGASERELWPLTSIGAEAGNCAPCVLQ
jgi:hypothetical protein